MNKFYISDTHFFHKNIMHLCNRPFSSVTEMNQCIINNWNSKVSSDDEVYFLGDFAMRYESIKLVYEIVEQLNGKKYFIRGNHDKCLKDKKFCSYFEWIKDYAEVNDDNRRVILFHYPLEDWNGRFHNSYHLYGHIHNNPLVRTDILNRFNVCADANNFEPQTLTELVTTKENMNYAE